MKHLRLYLPTIDRLDELLLGFDPQTQIIARLRFSQGMGEAAIAESLGIGIEPVRDMLDEVIYASIGLGKEVSCH